MRNSPHTYAETGLNLIKHELKVLRNSFFRRIFLQREPERDVIDAFVSLYFDSRADGDTYWLGVPCLKCPADLWIYQELIWDIRPDLIVECGTAYGGSALFMATICRLIDHGRVLTIDIAAGQNRPRHDRLTYVQGSSTSTEVVEQVATHVDDSHTILVVLDSDHTKEHVLDELRSYSRFVTKGSYLIVEDTIVNGHPAFPDFGPGPMEAVEQFLGETNDFVVDRSREKHLVTFNPRGYLRRVR